MLQLQLIQSQLKARYPNPRIAPKLQPGLYNNGNGGDFDDSYDFKKFKKHDPSDYKDGPSLFVDKFDYNNPNHTPQHIKFENSKRLNHSYDRHAEQCFGMTNTKNKKTLSEFEKNLKNFIQSPDTLKINGSYRYEDPAYHYMKPGENLIVTVNVIDNQYISVRNATDYQLEKLEIDGILGLDTRPNLSMTLRLRGPNSSNY